MNVNKTRYLRAGQKKGRKNERKKERKKERTNFQLIIRIVVCNSAAYFKLKINAFYILKGGF